MTTDDFAARQFTQWEEDWKRIEAQLDKGYNLAHDILNNLNTILSTGQTNSTGEQQ